MKAITIKNAEMIREQLLNLAKEIPGAKIGLKIAALLLVLDGERRGWVACVLGLSRRSLSRWVHRVNQEGVEDLKGKLQPGRPGQLTDQIRKRLEEHLDETPQKFGWNRFQWDGPTLVVHLKKYFGVKIKVRQAQKWMHQLGYRLKRASYSYLQARKEDAQRFQRSLKKNSKFV